VGSVGPNNTDEKIVGPFEWTPNINAYGHDCMLMVVSANGAPSNVDNFTAGEGDPAGRGGAHHHNGGPRTHPQAAPGRGTEGLLESLNGLSLWVGNPNPRRAAMELKVQLPPVLGRAGWRLGFEGLEGNRFALKSGERREVMMRLHAGKPFTRDAVEADP